MSRHTAIIVLAACVAGSGVLVAQGKVKQHGRAIVEYRSPEVTAVAAYEYAQRNHAGPWLLIDFAVQARKDRIAIERDQISLRTPDERVLRLAAHEEYLGDQPSLTRMYQNAHIFRRQLQSYFPSGPVRRTIRFFAAPGSTISDSAVTNPDEVASGDLIFLSPQGSWPAGTYQLILDHPKIKAQLPITLQ